MRLFPFALACLSLLPVLTLPTLADPAPPPQPSHLRPDILYTHKGEFIQVGPMRPLTLNAHVEQFAYDPLGLEIAYVGSEPSGENTLHFVKTIDARTGHEISRLTLTAPADSQAAGFYLLGFSPTGKYLLLKRYTPNPDKANAVVVEFLRWDLSANASPASVIDFKSQFPAETAPNDDMLGYPLSPKGRWIAFEQEVRGPEADGKPAQDEYAYSLYDTEQNTFHLLPLSPKTFISSWTDERHLAFWEHGVQRQVNVITGQVSPRPDISYTSALLASKQYPDLSLETEQRPLDDFEKSGGYTNSCLLWIRRTKFGALPMGAAVAGLMMTHPVIRESWSINPQAVWSPTGKQVAFIANNDLQVVDLATAAGALSEEKLAVGLPLDCADEQVLAVSNLKQIGLGIIQYSQDFDEKYPAAEGFEDAIYPFVKSRDLFQVDGHRFVYEQPADLALNKMDSPATTEQGYMDLPCARVVLMADGHVRTFPKEPAL